jgi:hypothetical protein
LPVLKSQRSKNSNSVTHIFIKWYSIIVGILKQECIALAKELGLEDRVFFLVPDASVIKKWLIL